MCVALESLCFGRSAVFTRVAYSKLLLLGVGGNVGVSLRAEVGFLALPSTDLEVPYVLQII